MSTDFHRTYVNDRSFIRGAARILAAPYSQPRPTKIEDVINLSTGGPTNEVQTVTITGTPTGGTFTLTYEGQTTTALAYNATASAVDTALEALSNIGVGDVTVTGGPAPGTPFTVTFTGALAGGNRSQMTANGSFTGGTTPAIAVTTTTPGLGVLYDAQAGWVDLGATKTGIQITVNNAEETFDVDQILGDIASQPTNWECSVGTQLAEFTLERMQHAWEGSAISTDATPTAPEQEMGVGNPTSYTKRRLAVLFQRPNGKIRAYLFHQVQRQPQESSITHAKTGEQISIPVRFRVLAETAILDPYKRFFIIRDQDIPA